MRKMVMIILLLALMLVSCSSNDTESESVVNLDKGLIAHWTFDMGTEENGVVTGLSSNQLTGTLYNGAELVESGINGCLELDGEDDYIQFPGAGLAAPSVFDTLGEGTISIWFKADSIPFDTIIAPLFSYGNGTPYPGMYDSNNEGIVIELAHGNMFTGKKRLYFTQFQEYASSFPVW